MFYYIFKNKKQKAKNNTSGIDKQAADRAGAWVRQRAIIQGGTVPINGDNVKYGTVPDIRCATDGDHGDIVDDHNSGENAV